VPPFDFTRASDLADEPRLLFDPVLDDVESCISFDVDDALCSAVAKSPVDATASERTHYTIKFFKLNTYPRLFKPRFEAVNQAFGALENVKYGDGSRQTELRKSASRYQPYGIAIRALLEKYAAELLPTRQEEVFWLVDEYLKYLTTIDTTRARHQDAETLRQLKREEAECCYALAVLIKDPPAASSAEIEQAVKQSGRTAQVRGYLDKLT
jgi:hypothetical protein